VLADPLLRLKEHVEDLEIHPSGTNQRWSTAT
jgi:hypothetical protein